MSEAKTHLIVETGTFVAHCELTVDFTLSALLKLTGVEEDHGLQTDVLLPLKLQLTKPRGGSQQHVEYLHDALNTLSLLPKQTDTQRRW